MKRMKRIVSVLVAVFIFATQGIHAEAATAAPESPAAWAIWDVQMAYTYGLGNTDSYMNYGSEVQGSQLLTVAASFEEKFTITDDTKVAEEDTLSRGEVIKELFDMINLTLKLDASSKPVAEEALAYFVDNGLIKGRSNNDYALDQPCTQQEMLAFSRRAYDYLIYQLNLEATGAFWKVSDADNTVYLLGSIHVTDGSVYPMSKEILNAFTDADALVVEANILVTKEEDMAYVQQKMMIEGDGTIDQLLSKEVYDAYVAMVQPLGVAPEVYNKLKPWYAAMLLQSVQLTTSYSAMGIDMYFLSMANGLKPIVELEGVKFQIDMFDSFTKELQEAYLQGVMEGEEDSDDIIGLMLADWKAGNVEDLEEMIFSEVGVTATEKEFEEKLWVTRNANMLKNVKLMLTEDAENDFFVVVGAGHMLNDDGIVAGLRALGYTVEQVK